ncbi:MFS family permease [Geosmithia morbida]|uniref:MFS family permease n=1 Tax=Geosmithia morbida TaxID=1094350 RepID=A0A9P4YZI7_9HYPO|nr:MFS family permease [Geosmithia morbida]KAF4125412.1 MFS family permease [Geosmithia morbida]
MAAQNEIGHPADDRAVEGIDDEKPNGAEDVDEGYDLFAEGSPRAITKGESRSVRRKLDRRLLPLMCVMYGLNYVDKVAMGWAVLFNFREELHLEGTQYSWASSMFYFGYLIAQYPANYILQRFQTSLVIGIMTLVWGALMLAHLGLDDFGGLMAIRFLLGVSESVVTPGFVIYTSMFYTRQEQVLRMTAWASMQGLFAIVATLMSYGLGHIADTALDPWMYIFLVLGILSILSGAAWIAWMPHTPNTASFLTHDERVIAVRRVASNMMGIKSYRWRNYQVWHAVKDVKTWLILAFVFFTMLPNGGLTNFGSLVTSGMGFGTFHTLLIGLPSSIVSSGSILAWGLISRRHENTRTLGMIIPLLPAIAGISAVYGTMDTGANKYGRVIAYWLINSYAVTWPFVLTIIGQNIAGHTKRATTNTLMLIIFSTGNIAGPFFFRERDAPKYVLAISVIMVCLCAALFCALALRMYMMWENRRRDRLYGTTEDVEDCSDGMNLGMHDKTDLENPDFRYLL